MRRLDRRARRLLGGAPPDIGVALSEVDNADPVIAFTHNPDVFPVIPPRVTLTLAGHTHGGQVRFPFWGAPVVPSHFGQRYAHGHVVERGRDLFVTSGLGTSIIPARFRVPPEIALLRLSSKETVEVQVGERIERERHRSEGRVDGGKESGRSVPAPSLASAGVQ